MHYLTEYNHSGTLSQPDRRGVLWLGKLWNWCSVYGDYVGDCVGLDTHRKVKCLLSLVSRLKSPVKAPS